ncbi:hypothetical protein CQ052_15470 [Ochrobactrum sp. MYb15]|uniref:hypothetical protein n=1 Tax=Brucella pituitosa TaxID=571256 RepID=UPI000CFB5DA1|nr:hypothetical protein CQZ90_08595 [Ochrobactrum sp. MYb19]PRA68673.1 hypothetical protein CQ053_03590 [Ochrobactrum sp. MYb18]PRA74100.1 hypothetical protein CQ049_12495 [Brucella thiophenivorans]PRA90925.1 hypothetical protein CQ051_13495 [Ochrobactrum sp. MYb14]PRA96375.1 hypothetical protein CQ052_15470 [Ochrobactrum sp. MYb15]
MTNDTYDPYKARGMGHNNPPSSPYETIKQEIEDLYGEAKLFADGEAIDNQALADAVTELHDKLHEAGKRADEARKDEAKPHDDAKAEIQTRYNKLIGNTKTSGKGKVVLGKEVLQGLLTPWRNKVAAEKEAAAKAAREEADRVIREVQEAMQASAGNLEAREQAEELIKEAKQADRWAKREDKAATTGTGLRSVWHCDLVDEGVALDWAYARAPERFKVVVQAMAEETVRAGMRQVPGFTVREERVAR